jgi:uncharacterized protein YybS (DUF2232 family)
MLLAALWIPIAGPVLSLLTPIPFLYYSTKLGLRRGVLVSALAAATVGLLGSLAGQPQILLFCVEFGVLGLVLSVLFRKGLGFGSTIVGGTGAMLLAGLILLTGIGSSGGVGLTDMLRGYMEAQLKGTLAAYRELGVTGEEAAELDLLARTLVNWMIQVYPSLMIVGTGFAVWLNVVTARPLFTLTKLPYPDFPPVDRWQAPEVLVWGVIGAGFALFLGEGGLRVLAANGVIVLLAVYLFQGISIVLFFLNKYRTPGWARVGVYALIAAQQVFLAVLALVGLFDQWIDFRKIHRRRQG